MRPGCPICPSCPIWAFWASPDLVDTDEGITGVSKTAASRIASAASNKTCDNRSAADGSFASFHGAVCAMNSLVASINRNAAAAPSWTASPSIAWR